MKRLSRHVSLTVLLAMLMVQAMLLGLDLVFSFIGELDNVRGGFGAWQAFQYTLYILPSHSYEILPMSALIGALVGLGTLASNSELTIMRAAGVSLARIVWWVVRGALVVIVLGMALGEYVVPITEQRGDALKARALGQDYEPGRIKGYWQREGNELINIRVVTPEGELLGVSRYAYGPDGELQQAVFAARGDYHGSHWLLHEVQATDYLPDASAQVKSLPSLDWVIDLTPEFLRVAAAPPQQLGLADLHAFAQYLKRQSLDAGSYDLQFWKKLLSPLAVFSMMLVACSFIFGPLRSVTLGFRIITGVLVGLGFRYVQDAAGFASLIYHTPPLLSVIIPIVLTMALGGLALYRAR
ncbi:MAG: LPS export ABC transporter permease LptG [Paraperlucidibaca sp.]